MGESWAWVLQDLYSEEVWFNDHCPCLIFENSLISWLGYSWKTNQYGLTIDSVVAFELVKPDGNVVIVTETSYPKLFWGLKVRSIMICDMQTNNILPGWWQQFCRFWPFYLRSVDKRNLVFIGNCNQLHSQNLSPRKNLGTMLLFQADLTTLKGWIRVVFQFTMGVQRSANSFQTLKRLTILKRVWLRVIALCQTLNLG